MTPLPAPGLLRRAAREHRRLERLAAALPADDPVAVLHLGSAVLLHGFFEETYLFAAHRLLDRAVCELLCGEHDEIREGLALLEDLLRDPGSPEDLPSLAAALARRVQEHVERDGRILYTPLERMNLLET